MTSQKERPQPPQAPEIDRSLQFGKVQVIGMSIFILIPLAAILGLFGDTTDRASAAASGLEIAVEYPDRFRYKTISPLTVTVRNATATTLDTVEVRFPHSLVSGFSEVTFTPQPQSVTDSAYIVVLTDIEAGSARRVDAQVQAERYGSHGGVITASSSGGAVSTEVTSFVFP